MIIVLILSNSGTRIVKNLPRGHKGAAGAANTAHFLPNLPCQIFMRQADISGIADGDTQNPRRCKQPMGQSAADAEHGVPAGQSYLLTGAEKDIDNPPVCKIGTAENPAIIQRIERADHRIFRFYHNFITGKTQFGNFGALRFDSQQFPPAIQFSAGCGKRRDQATA